MRLLIATPLYPPEPGGPATYARLLETGLEKEGLEEPILVKFSDVRKYPKVFRHFAYCMRVYEAGKHADAILALDPVSVGFPAFLAARLLRKPFLVKVVGDYAWEQGVQRFGIKDPLDAFVRRGRVPFAVSMLRAVQVHVAKSAKNVIVPSEYLKGIVSAWRVPVERITVIYNAIELEEGGVVPIAAQAALAPRIVTIGRLVPWKGMRGIIDAVAQLEPPASLTIVGDGPERSALEAHAKKMLGERCVFTGALAHADALATLREADIFVLNSTYEGLSHVLIEALMLGKPIIATKAGGNAELITSGENGLLVAPNDAPALILALTQLLTDPALKERLSLNAKAGSSRFSTGTMIGKTAALLRTV
jgi:glycosyltransferase involved in cell wall biosynthesis